MHVPNVNIYFHCYVHGSLDLGSSWSLYGLGIVVRAYIYSVDMLIGAIAAEMAFGINEGLAFGAITSQLKRAHPLWTEYLGLAWLRYWLCTSGWNWLPILQGFALTT